MQANCIINMVQETCTMKNISLSVKDHRFLKDQEISLLTEVSLEFGAEGRARACWGALFNWNSWTVVVFTNKLTIFAGQKMFLYLFFFRGVGGCFSAPTYTLPPYLVGAWVCACQIAVLVKVQGFKVHTQPPLTNTHMHITVPTHIPNLPEVFETHMRKVIYLKVKNKLHSG